MQKGTRLTIKWIVYIVLLLLAFVLQTSVSVWSIAGIRPILIVPFVVALSMQEREVFALVFGLLGGFLWDYSSGTIAGFHAMVLMICCVVISLAVTYYMGNHFLIALMFCAGTMILQGLLDYLFGYVIWDYEGSGWALLREILPTAAYTVAVTPLFFFLLRWIHRLLEGKEEQ